MLHTSTDFVCLSPNSTCPKEWGFPLLRAEHDLLLSLTAGFLCCLFSVLVCTGMTLSCGSNLLATIWSFGTYFKAGALPSLSHHTQTCRQRYFNFNLSCHDMACSPMLCNTLCSNVAVLMGHALNPAGEFWALEVF